MDLPDDVRNRLAKEQIAWLTTVNANGQPAPNPVWLVLDGESILVFAQPGTVKVRNIAERPAVSVHLNSTTVDGADVLVVNGTAVLEPDQAPSREPGYLDKYGALWSSLEMSIEDLDTYSTRIRITPTRYRLAVVY